MERSLLMGAAALGILGWILSFAVSRGDRSGPAWRLIEGPFRWAAVLLAPIVFLLTLPSAPPFSEGHGFGRGFLIGAVASLLSVVAVVESKPSERSAANGLHVATPLWLALPAVAIPILFLRSVLMDALMGVAIGALSVTAIVYHGMPKRQAQAGYGSGAILLSGAGYVAALVAAAGLGAYRGGEVSESLRWAASAVLVGASVPLALLVSALPPAFLLGPLRRVPGASAVSNSASEALRTEDRREFASAALRVLVGAAIVLFVSWLAGSRLLNSMQPLYVTAVGAGMGLLAWWLAADSGGSNETGLTPYRQPLTVLVALGAAMISFNLLLGFGIGLMTLGLWLPFGLALCGCRDRQRLAGEEAPPSSEASAQALWSLAAFATILLLYRFVSTRFQVELRGVTLADHYALFGFMAGATVPAVLGGLAEGSPGQLSFSRLARLTGAGLLALALPGLILLLWKAKAALALLAGAALAASGFSWRSSSSGAAPALRAQVIPLMAIAVCLAIAQWSPLALDAATLTRDQKISILRWLLGGIAAILVALELSDRWRPASRAGSNDSASGREATR